MNESTSQPVCPWPGLMPYDADRAACFPGRQREKADLVARCAVQALTVVTGESGAGKTSLLRAGVVPALRGRRVNGDSWVGPVFLLREWGKAQGRSPSELIVDALVGQLPDMEAAARKAKDEMLVQALTQMQKVPLPGLGGESTSLRDRTSLAARYVIDLCGAMAMASSTEMRYLFLIIDQAEELMGSGLSHGYKSVETEAIEVLRLILTERSARVLLSLREEYVARLGALDSHGMGKALYPVFPLRLNAANQAFRESVQNVEGVYLENRALEGILETCVGEESQPGQEIGAVQRDARGDVPVKLLGVQALLVALWHRALRRQEGGTVKITYDLLQEYWRESQEVSGANLADCAMQDWVSRCWDDPPEGLLRDPVQRGLSRRAAARMAPLLSTWGGFKRPVDEIELAVQTIKDDLAMLPLAGERSTFEPRLAASLRRWQEDPVGFDNLFRDDSPVPAGYLSGIARKEQWTVPETARKVAEAAFAAIALLEEFNVLKPGRGSSQGAQSGATYVKTLELVHDGMGDPFKAWADRQAQSLEFRLVSVVASRGESFPWQSLPDESAAGRASHEGKTPMLCLTWLGCVFEGATLKGMVFERCDLRGTIFTDCTLIDCSFIDCDLRGCGFLENRWRGVRILAKEPGESKCGAFLVASTSWEQVSLTDSDLSGATIEELTLTGPTELRDCEARFAQIGKITNPKWLNVSNCDFHNSLFEDFREEWRDHCNAKNLIRTKDLLDARGGKSPA